MEPEHKDGDIKDRILRSIRKGEVSMHARPYFALKLAALVVVLALALIVSILMFSFIFFIVRVNIGDAFSQGNGLLMFVRFFPWHLLILEVMLLVIAEAMIRSFKFGYRSPMLYLALGLLAAVIALGLFIDRDTHFNDDMFDRAHHHRLPPPFNDLYEHAHRDDLFPPAPTSTQELDLL